MAAIYRTRIMKKDFYDRGGLIRTDQYRVHNGRHWVYWKIMDHI